MKTAIAAIVAVAPGLAAANMLGVAAAEAPTTTASPRTVSVVGVATAPVAQGASAEAAIASYRQGMASALSDGQSKAEFLASKAAVTLGSVQSITEDGGSISCTGGEEEGGYVEYQGQQPDFGSTSSATRVVAPLAEGVAKPGARKPAAKKHKSKAPAAKKASATTCTLSASVSLVYAIA
jgi:hypothetical protein